MPRQPGPIRPRVRDAKQYEARLRAKILDPLFVDLQIGLAQAAGADQAYRAITGAVRTANLRGVDPDLVTEWLQRVDGYQKSRLIQTYRSALGVDVGRLLTEPEIQAFMRQKLVENVRLIQTIPPRLHDSLRRRLEDALAEAPFDRARLTGILRQEYKSSGYNLRRIARDQTNKATGQLTEIRQRQLGVEGYRWSTSKDERVRPRHVAREGQYFRWDSPPEGGPPGAEVLCRCVGIPVLLQRDRDRLRASAQAT